MIQETVTSTGCCDPFDPVPWENNEIQWQDKLFVKDHVSSFAHIPLNMNKKMIKNMKLIEKAAAKAPNMIMLSDEKSPWGSDIFIEVSKSVPGARMATISGTFLSKVFEGSYQNMGKWVKEMHNYVKEKNKTLDMIYFYYSTCPKCAKAYGKNYVVLLAKVS
jgi:hypothetical protein